MEQEKFISGYCRTLDCSRLVTAILEDGVLEEVDCSYPDCVYAPNCAVAKELRELTE